MVRSRMERRRRAGGRLPTTGRLAAVALLGLLLLVGGSPAAGKKTRARSARQPPSTSQALKLAKQQLQEGKLPALSSAPGAFDRRPAVPLGQQYAQALDNLLGHTRDPEEMRHPACESNCVTHSYRHVHNTLSEAKSLKIVAVLERCARRSCLRGFVTGEYYLRRIYSTGTML